MTQPGYDLMSQTQRVLCPQLYDKLCQISGGDVKLANEGEAMLTHSAWSEANRAYHMVIIHSGEYYRLPCPYCDDTRHRLWVNHMYGQPDPNGNPMRFLATCYNENCMEKRENFLAFYDAVYGFKNVGERQRTLFSIRDGEHVEPVLQQTEPPGEVIPLASMPENHPAATYMLKDRRYTREMLERYAIGYCCRAKPEYPTAQDRIVFPIYMNGQLVGWQCRYVGKANWKTVPKYYTKPKMKKRLVLYNFDRAKQYKFVVVVEGPTDSNVVGDPSVAILGKSLSFRQRELLTTTWFRRPIIFMLDPDAREESRATINDLANVGSNPVVNIELPGEFDPADYGREAIWQIIYGECRRHGIVIS